MFHRRRRRERVRWLLAGFAPLAAASLWVIAEAIRRRMRLDRSYPRAYGLEDPAGQKSSGLRVASIDSGEEFAETPLREEESHAQPGRFRAVGQVPVTAKGKSSAARRGQHHGDSAVSRGRRSGPARFYDSPDDAGSAPSAPRAMLFNRDQKSPFPWLLLLVPLLILGGVLFMALQGRNPAREQVMAVPGGNPEVGRQMVQSWGCGSCHTIPGVDGANGVVGPRLQGLSERTYIAGILPNTPENMIRWIINPQAIQPGNGMPDTGVSDQTARDMAAYLYSIK